MVRLFIAVDLSSEVRSKVIAFRDAVSNSGADVKPVEDENLHITLRFLGEVRDDLLTELKHNLSNLSFNSFRMHVKGTGAFPSISSPRVIWVGVEEGEDQLRALHDAVEELVGKYGVSDEREFTPHITVARVRGRASVLGKLINQWRDFDFGWQTVDSVTLKKSTLTPRGPIYEDLLTIRLK
ncbi:RNA 2',3'-cyclic phosphodiesterase [Caldivirga sp.]|uniref:RNA 2',3'-cyclic phosphodiesterase n=1 Tax=Caldivirga sp. TaxID=2080243 RepID=UPI0025C3BB19|nr:RNA 2',3'-cyclic phosphodiesterase [Caldivirga sp.]